MNGIFHLELLFNSSSINITKRHKNHTNTYILKKELKSYNSQEIFCIFSKTPDAENNSEFVNVICTDM